MAATGVGISVMCRVIRNRLYRANVYSVRMHQHLKRHTSVNEPVIVKQTDDASQPIQAQYQSSA